MSELYAAKLEEVELKIFIEPPSADWESKLIPSGELATYFDDANYQDRWRFGVKTQELK